MPTVGDILVMPIEEIVQCGSGGIPWLTGRATSAADCEKERGLWVSGQVLMVARGGCVNV